MQKRMKHIGEMWEKIENKLRNLSPVHKLKYKQELIDEILNCGEKKRIKPNVLELFFSKTTKLLSKYSTREEQKKFLNRIIDEKPWLFIKIVGEIDKKTGLSENGFDMSLIDSDRLNFKNGYLYFDIYGVQNNVDISLTFLGASPEGFLD